MIFPGMDPYLEDPQLWTGLHSRLVVYVADQLQPQLRPRYLAAVEERVYVEGPNREVIPDVWIKKVQRKTYTGNTVALAEAETPEIVLASSTIQVRENYINILDRQTGQEIVTVIEVLSPTNKWLGPGRDSYAAKQRQVLGSNANLVEIDLLRDGSHTLAIPQSLAKARGAYEYLISVNRAAELRELFEIYRVTLQQRLPRVRIPLADGDPDAVLDLQAVIGEAYDKGDYRDRIDYAKPCQPPLVVEDQAWANQLIQQAAAS